MPRHSCWSSADWLNSHLEEWCTTSKGRTRRREAAALYPPHAQRPAPTPEPHPNPDTLELTLGKRRRHAPGSQHVSGDFLHCVRLGIRPADDPIIRDSVDVYDAMLKHDLPGGPSWRRYCFDGYGQKSNGEPYDGTGEGRCWADPHRRARTLRDRRRSRSHAVHPRDGTIRQHDRPAPRTSVGRGRHSREASIARPTQRLIDAAVLEPRGISKLGAFMVTTGKFSIGLTPRISGMSSDKKRDTAFEIWTFRHRNRHMPAGRTLRLVVKAKARVRWTIDDWKTFQRFGIDVAKCASPWSTATCRRPS